MSRNRPIWKWRRYPFSGKSRNDPARGAGAGVGVGVSAGVGVGVGVSADGGRPGTVRAALFTRRSMGPNGEGLGDQPLDVVVAQVGADRHRPAAFGLDGGHGVVDGAGQAGVEHRLGAAAATATAAPSTRERPHDGLTDAPTHAGDDRDPTLEPTVGHITVRYWLPSAIDGSAKKRIMLVCT